ncbi:(2Fe-2S)-binding protein [Novosphingobium sp. PC22D]|nr:(2Fe-2S)-binding protein [Novosphingobium sp. PC22D]
MPLLWVLRDVLGLTGTKFGCGAGLCGACTVHLDGAAARSCLTPVSMATGKEIVTIAGLSSTRVGRAVQGAWLAQDVVQCGYCQPGQMLSAAALLTDNSDPSDDEIDAGMSGNICRCGTYQRIRAAIRHAADELSA